jgi:ribosome recycling factor
MGGMNMYRQVIENAKVKMEKTKDFYQKDMLSLRAGRANPQILDRITVDYYGTATPLKQMGNINSPEPRLLTISLWDPKAIPLVEKAIQKSDLGMNPSNDGKVIRLVVPELNEERRRELTKVVRKGAEEAKVAMRNTRRDAMEQIKKLKKDSQITEDDQRKAEEDLQKMTDGQIKDVDKIAAEKEKEIMEV